MGGGNHTEYFAKTGTTQSLAQVCRSICNSGLTSELVYWKVILCAVSDARSREREESLLPSRHLSRTLCIQSYSHARPCGRYPEDRLHHIKTKPGLVPGILGHVVPWCRPLQKPLDVAWSLINGTAELINLIFLPSLVS